MGVLMIRTLPLGDCAGAEKLRKLTPISLALTTVPKRGGTSVKRP